MTDPSQERTDEYLNTQDAAADWTPGGNGDGDGDFAPAPSYDEWNARRILAGKAPGTFSDYLADMTPAVDPVVMMLARRWAAEAREKGDGVEGDLPF